MWIILIFPRLLLGRQFLDGGSKWSSVLLCFTGNASFNWKWVVMLSTLNLPPMPLPYHFNPISSARRSPSMYNCKLGHGLKKFFSRTILQMLHFNDQSETDGLEISTHTPTLCLCEFQSMSKVCMTAVTYVCVPSGVCVRVSGHKQLNFFFFFVKHMEEMKPGKPSPETEGGESLKLWLLNV